MWHSGPQNPPSARVYHGHLGYDDFFFSGFCRDSRLAMTWTGSWRAGMIHISSRAHAAVPHTFSTWRDRRREFADYLEPQILHHRPVVFGNDQYPVSGAQAQAGAERSGFAYCGEGVAI